MKAGLLPLLIAALARGASPGCAPPQGPPLAEKKPQPSGAKSLPPQTGIVYGDGHAYMLTAPDGWTLDNKVWADQGVFAVFYPEGSSTEGNWVAYSRIQASNPKGLLAAAVADLEGMKQQSPKYAWRGLPDIRTSDRSTAIVFSTSGDSLGNAEFLAYIQARTCVVLISAVTKTPSDQSKLWPAFEKLVHSYA